MAQSAPPTALERVVVTANRTPQPLATVLADLTVIDRDEIERTGVAGVADLLARQPGIEITRNGEKRRYLAVPMPQARETVNALMAEKYGWGDQVIGLLISRDAAQVMRLDPR